MAITTLSVKSSIGNGFKTDVDCSHHLVIDQPKQAGGNNEGPNPLEIFLSSLGACICALGRIISNQRRLGVRNINVKIEGDIDKDFLMGKTDEGRAGFREIRSIIDIDADMSKEDKEKLIKEISSRCPVADNVLGSTVVKPQLAA